MLGKSISEPLGYGGFVIILFEIVQVVRVKRADAAQDFSERVTFDRVNLAVGMLPKSLYGAHDNSPCKKILNRNPISSTSIQKFPQSSPN